MFNNLYTANLITIKTSNKYVNLRDSRKNNFENIEIKVNRYFNVVVKLIESSFYSRALYNSKRLHLI